MFRTRTSIQPVSALGPVRKVIRATEGAAAQCSVLSGAKMAWCEARFRRVRSSPDQEWPGAHPASGRCATALYQKWGVAQGFRAKCATVAGEIAAPSGPWRGESEAQASLLGIWCENVAFLVQSKREIRFYLSNRYTRAGPDTPQIPGKCVVTPSALVGKVEFRPQVSVFVHTSMRDVETIFMPFPNRESPSEEPLRKHGKGPW